MSGARVRGRKHAWRQHGAYLPLVASMCTLPLSSFVVLISTKHDTTIIMKRRFFSLLTTR